MPKKKNAWFLHTQKNAWFLNKTKKNPTHPFVDIGKTETCAKFQQKILNCPVVGARQSFQLFRQITWFLGNKIALPKFK